MGTSTLHDKQEAALKPRKETIDFILNYSKATDSIQLKNGEPVRLIKN